MYKVIFIIGTFLFFQEYLFSQNLNIKFEHITPEQGLSSNAICDVVQDHQGFIWFGTLNNGLNKYDGYKFTVYKHIPGDSTSLRTNRVEVIYEDHLGQLWVGMKNGGLCRYNRDMDNFTRYYPKRNDSTSISTSGPLTIF